MSRRSEPSKVVDDRRFRFRVKFRRPDIGIWAEMDELEDFLRQGVGPKGYAIHPIVWQIGDCYAVHFDDRSIFGELMGILDRTGRFREDPNDEQGADLCKPRHRTVTSRTCNN